MALAEACVKDFAPETGEGKIDASSLAATDKNKTNTVYSHSEIRVAICEDFTRWVTYTELYYFTYLLFVIS